MSRRAPILAVLTTLALTVTALAGPALADQPDQQGQPGQPGPQARLAVSSVDARWVGGGDVTKGEHVTASIAVQGQVDGAAGDLVVLVGGVQVRGIPAGCVPSSTVVRASSVSADGTTLVCQLAPGAVDPQVLVDGVVTAEAGTRISGAVTVGGATSQLGTRTALAGAPVPSRRLRLLSSPDFLNADVGDLHRGPGRWTPSTSSNAVNGSYRASLDTVLDDWRSLDPDAVLVAGDLVEGHWDRDTRRTRTFGPVRTTAQQRESVRRAARTFYPQWLERFTSRGLDVYPAIGDHEVGDNPWPRGKRRLVDTFKKQFARYFTTTPSGPRFADRPRRSRAELTSYAFRPVPEVQVVSLDVFDITARRARIGLDKKEMRWLRGVLARAETDGVRWTIVQGHTPVLGPVRARGSSELRVTRGERSALWRTFETYGVDLYLAGEVHDVTLTEHGGVAQLTHGGLFQYGLTNYALLDVSDDRLDIDLRDYAATVKRRGRRLWETAGPGLPRQVRVSGPPVTIGTASITAGGGLQDRTGYLVPYTRR